MSSSNGPDVIRLQAGSAVLVGRSAPAASQLTHPMVSRRHAELRYDGGRAVVRDLGGPAGTKVDHVPIRTRELTDGARVEFGPVAYEYRRGELRRLDGGDGVGLEARGLSVARGGRVLLSGVSLRIEPGAFVGLLGPSGAGKSTLLRCLAGYLPPAAGTVAHGGTDLAGDPVACQAQAGYVPQEDVIFLSLTCRENLAYALALRSAGDLSAAERDEIVDRTLDKVKLSDRADKPAARLSGGERKRLNVALELLGKPRVLFLDEPTSGQDPATETRLMRGLKSLADGGTTIVCSTHVMENLNLFTQVIVVGGGTARDVGRPENLLTTFRAADYPSLYLELERLQSAPQPAPAASRSRPARAEPRRQRPLRQCATLSLRGLHLLARDLPLLLLLAGQPIGIGLLINCSQAARPNKLDATFLFCVTSALWMGLSNTAREVVRDRASYARERSLGVSSLNYLASKVLSFSVVGLAQVLTLALIVRYLSFMRGDDAGEWQHHLFLHFVLVLWTTNLCGLLLGLLVSTLANSQEAAVAILPLLVLPQLLLSGLATNLDEVNKGHFGSLVVLVNAEKPKNARPTREVLTEAASFLTYSRPATVLLQRPPDRFRRRAMLVGWLHQTLMILLTGAALLAAFCWTERGWLERL